MSENAVATEATETASTDTESTATESTEATTATTDEAAAAETAAPAAPTGPTKEEIDAALDSFVGLVDSILGSPKTNESEAVAGKIDPQNGEVPAEHMKTVVEAFLALPGGTRAHNKAIQLLADKQMTALTEHMWAVGARAIALMLNALRAAGKGTKAKVETVAKPTVSPTVAHVATAVAHILAVNFLPVGSDVDDNWGELTNAKVTELASEVGVLQKYLADKATYDALTDEQKADTAAFPEPTQPEVDAIILQAARIARGRVAGPKKAAATREPKVAGSSVPRDPSAPRGDILAHIQEVFAELPVGTFLKVSAIAKVATSQYGAGQASGGAISARIKGEAFSKVEGLEFVSQDGGQGVRKTA